GVARVDWAAQAPLLGRLQHFAEFCSGVFTATVAEMKRRYPAKTQQPAFVSAVAMKSFFRIFALEDTQDTFLELLDEAGALLEVMGMTNLVSDLLSGHLYEQMLAPGKLTAAGNGGSVGLGGLADLFLSAPALRSATSTTTAVSAAGEQEAEEEEMDNSAAFVSNEQFEGIMELYDSMFRDDETRNATAAKLELAGRVFLQGWYESMRRFGRERGKLAPKPFTPADFANYMEAIEVPFSNIIDFAYPLNNERACDGPPEVTLVAVLSRSRNAALRRAIRQTWAVPTALGGGLKVVFLMSDRETERPALRQESEEFRDIVTVDVPETYDYLPRRVLALLDWASRYCAAAAYVFKTTEQVYLNATLLREQVDFAKKAGAAESADAPVQIVGNLVKNASVERNPLFLQHLFYDEYPFDSLPTHLRGFGYLLSRDFAKQAVAVAKDFPLMRTDDLLVSAILANKLKVAPHAFQKGQRVYALGRGQLTQPDTRKVKEEVCREKRDTLVFGGKLDAPEMLLLHEYLLSCPA
ncbi:uncharacterized protein LOC129598311, partial [Paramacrobiotus metropolitanus]|uniref:uncharacterized protein LOC129598311 n=1 Tax=Paramacrobiotus metropolitanus TaxID=2943436 RepID=UPI002445BB2A